MSVNNLINFPFSLPFILDGATGTELSKRGMGSNDCTETFILNNPEQLKCLQTEYINSGSNAVLAPTFGANRATLLRHGYCGDDVETVCRKLFNIAKENAGDKKVGGDISPTGLMMKPYGDTDPEEIFNIYREQAAVLLDCGADFFFIETMISAAEARMAVSAVRDLSKDTPVFVSMTVNESGRTMNGDTMGATLLTMIPYGINAFGCNCSIGPDVVANALSNAASIAKLYGIPLIAKANAGIPVTDDTGTHYPLTATDMANSVDKLTGLGVGIFGGCCGTTPAHIKEIADAAKSTTVIPFSDVEPAKEGNYISTSRIFAVADDNAEYVPIDSNSEDDIYDLLDEYDPDEILYFELKDGAADLILRMDAFIPNPIAVKGNEEEIIKIEKTLCRKVR